MRNSYKPNVPNDTAIAQDDSRIGQCLADALLTRALAETRTTCLVVSRIRQQRESGCRGEVDRRANNRVAVAWRRTLPHTTHGRNELASFIGSMGGDTRTCFFAARPYFRGESLEEFLRGRPHAAARLALSYCMSSCRATRRIAFAQTAAWQYQAQQHHLLGSDPRRKNLCSSMVDCNGLADHDHAADVSSARIFDTCRRNEPA